MKILVSDDQVDVLEAIRLLLKGAGHHTETADSPRAALAAAGRASFDLVLMDMNYSRDTTSGEEGVELMRAIVAPTLIVVGELDGITGTTPGRIMSAALPGAASVDVAEIAAAGHYPWIDDPAGFVCVVTGWLRDTA